MLTQHVCSLTATAVAAECLPRCFQGFPGEAVRNPSCSVFVWIFCLQTDLRLRRRYNPQGWGLYAEDPNILVSTPAKLSGNG
jgi:hypothetical protein